MIVLGLDPSLSNFGWAVHDSAEVGRKKCPHRGRFQTSSRTLFIDRYVDLRTRLCALLEEHTIHWVGVEYPVFNATYSPGLYGLFLYTCEALRTQKCDVVFFSPGQGKAQAREVLGRPRGWKMMKPDMIEAACFDLQDSTAHESFVGRVLRDTSWRHDEADAYWIARTAARFWLLQDGAISESDLTPLESKQFLEIHTYTRGRRLREVEARGILYRENERFFRWSLGAS